MARTVAYHGRVFVNIGRGVHKMEKTLYVLPYSEHRDGKALAIDHVLQCARNAGKLAGWKPNHVHVELTRVPMEAAK